LLKVETLLNSSAVIAAEEGRAKTHRGQSGMHERPVNTVKSLLLVKRQNGVGGARGRGKLNNVTKKGNVFTNESARDPTSLIFIDHQINDLEQTTSDYSSSKLIINIQEGDHPS